jgi:ribonuclease P protein component
MQPADVCAETHNDRCHGCGSKGFPRQSRLLKPQEFKRIFQSTDCKSVDQYLTVLARRNSLPHARLGLAISKRVIKTAVGRNRIKRLVRESFRQQQAGLQALDIVVLCRNGAVDASNEVLFAALDKHWHRLNKRCANS